MVDVSVFHPAIQFFLVGSLSIQSCTMYVILYIGVLGVFSFSFSILLCFPSGIYFFGKKVHQRKNMELPGNNLRKNL
jgi:hypothetical protein